MNELEQARETIDRVDREMARLFEERMHAVEAVAHYKQQRGLPVLDAKREREVIARNLTHIRRDELRPLYRRFLEESMALSRELQATLLSKDSTNTLTVHTPSREYPVYFVRGAIGRADVFFHLNRRVFILTDDGVPPEYAEAVAAVCASALIHTVKA